MTGRNRGDAPAGNRVVAHQPRPWRRRDRVDWLRIVTTAGLDYLREQTSEISRIRDRSVTFVAFVGAALAFLIGASLTSVPRNGWFYLLAAVGSLGLVIVGFALYRVIAPVALVQTVLEPAQLTKWMIGQKQQRNAETAILRLVRDTLPGMISNNEAALTRIRFWYRFLLVAGLLTLGVWCAMVWVHA